MTPLKLMSWKIELTFNLTFFDKMPKTVFAHKFITYECGCGKLKQEQTEARLKKWVKLHGKFCDKVISLTHENLESVAFDLSLNKQMDTPKFQL